MTLREKYTLWACFHLFEIKFVWLILRFIQLIVSSADQLDVFPNQKYIVGIMKTQPRKLRILGNSYARCPQGAANTRMRRPSGPYADTREKERLPRHVASRGATQGSPVTRWMSVQRAAERSQRAWATGAPAAHTMLRT